MAKKVKCPICGKEFYKAGLNGHMRFKHGQQFTTSLGKPSIPREEAKATLLTKEQAKPLIVSQQEGLATLKVVMADLFKEVWEKELFKERVRQIVREVLQSEGFK